MQPHQSTLSHSTELKQKSKQKPELQSINQLYMSDDGSTCSYCHKGRSYSWGLVNKQFDCYTYEIMMERGWRRCGTYYYKPDLEKSCCKLWTHRLDVNMFKIKKDQKKTVKKIITIAYQPVIVEEGKQQPIRKKSLNTTIHHKQPKPTQQKSHPKQPKITLQVSKKFQQLIHFICISINNLLQNQFRNLIPIQKLNQDTINQSWNMNIQQKLKCFISKPEDRSDYYCNWGMLVYGLNKRKFNAKGYGLVDFVKDIKKFVEMVQIPNKGEDFFVELQRGGYLKIELSKKLKQQKSQQFQIIKQIQPHQMQIQSRENQKKTNLNNSKEQTKMEEEKQKISEILMQKKHSSIHFEKLEPEFKGELNITTDKITFGKLEIRLVKAQADKQSYAMYEAYCKDIHEKEDQVTLSSFTDFLCLKALKYENYEKQAQKDKFYMPSFDLSEKHQKRKQVKGKVIKRVGCYHMKYYLQNKFIGVGVVDILPHGLSSVYFFYSPQYKQKRLGVFSSIIEIQYVRYLSLTFPQFKYYYMGFYIQDNHKMAYKGDYGPYQLLCPITYNFVTVDDRVKEIVNKIVRNGNKNIRLTSEDMIKDADMTFAMDLGVYIDKHIKLKYRGKNLKLNQINPQFFIPVLQLLKAYIQVWGHEVFDILTFTF